MDNTLFRNICGTFATGVTVITCENQGEIHGMTANGFMSVSLDPPLILISVGNYQKSHHAISESKQFGVSILDDTQMHLSNHFAGKTDPNLKIDFERCPQNIPYLKQNMSFFTAKVISHYQEGDHSLFIGEVLTCDSDNDGKQPLVFFKGKYQKINTL